MNKETRKQISKIIEGIESVVIDAKDALESYKNEIGELIDAEQEKLDNMAEKFEGTERYDMMEQAVENLDSAYDAIDELIDAIDSDDLVSYLTEATE